MAERRISVMGRRLAESWSSGDLTHFKDSILTLMDKILHKGGCTKIFFDQNKTGFCTPHSWRRIFLL